MNNTAGAINRHFRHEEYRKKHNTAGAIDKHFRCEDHREEEQEDTYHE